MCCTVERCGYTRIGADDMYRNLRITGCQKRLVKATACCETSKGMYECFHACCCHTGSNTNSILLCDSGIEYSVGEFRLKFSYVDTPAQITVYMYDCRIIFHQLCHCSDITITICSCIFFMFTYQCITHNRFLLY